MGELYQGAQIFEQGGLLKRVPDEYIIVRSWHYNRENNEVVELPVAHQSITEFMQLRKSVCLMRCKFGRRAVPTRCALTSISALRSRTPQTPTRLWKRAQP